MHYQGQHNPGLETGSTLCWQYHLRQFNFFGCFLTCETGTVAASAGALGGLNEIRCAEHSVCHARKASHIEVITMIDAFLLRE